MSKQLAGGRETKSTTGFEWSRAGAPPCYFGGEIYEWKRSLVFGKLLCSWASSWYPALVKCGRYRRSSPQQVSSPGGLILGPGASVFLEVLRLLVTKQGTKLRSQDSTTHCFDSDTSQCYVSGGFLLHLSSLCISPSLRKSEKPSLPPAHVLPWLCLTRACSSIRTNYLKSFGSAGLRAGRDF